MFAGFLPISGFGHMNSIGTLLACVIVGMGVMAMRKTNPNLPRLYKTRPVPILGVVVCFAMMRSPDGIGSARLVVWPSLGLVIYFM